MKIYIKNMVCKGTRYFVIQELEKLGFSYSTFDSGEIDLEKDLTQSEKIMIYQSLQKYGLELSFGKSSFLSKIRNSFQRF
jgi:hypothetical protein